MVTRITRAVRITISLHAWRCEGLRIRRIFLHVVKLHCLEFSTDILLCRAVNHDRNRLLVLHCIRF